MKTSKETPQPAEKAPYKPLHNCLDCKFEPEKWCLLGPSAGGARAGICQYPDWWKGPKTIEHTPATAGTYGSQGDIFHEVYERHGREESAKFGDTLTGCYAYRCRMLEEKEAGK